MSGHQEAVVKELTQFEGGLNYGNHRKCYERLGRKWRDRKNLWKMCQGPPDTSDGEGIPPSCSKSQSKAHVRHVLHSFMVMDIFLSS